MTLQRTNPRRCRDRTCAFTLAEVLAALAFMAIVIPVAVEGLRVASAAGVVAERKWAATEIAERVLQEAILTGQWQSGRPSGVIRRDGLEYEYALRSEPWLAEPMRLNLRVVTVQVGFTVQGRPYDVTLSTLAGGTTL